MDCKTVQRQLVDYLLDELDSKLEIRISEHLVNCTACQKEAERLELLFQSIRDEEPVVPSDRVLNRIRLKTGSKAAMTPLTILQKPVRLYHALATLILGIVLATLSNVGMKRTTAGPETVAESYQVIRQSPVSDSITFYTAPSHRLGGT
jgi:predicted anti-sigma-YlaC factor YlaD